ncbi:DNA repair protein RecO [Iodidimonas gelatinilytica]|uniref:DNA repair protein RecO n=1 Tax=Iodidimonas gelatinilytica TaxID=1236966 RepID=A0A5A7MZ70_9PROT|nr:DNA repair protein RecO [Iodidimonas gelatinilytica]GER01361.1 DNA repair protein RecO [Iodidimonas gelatinilytica]
MEWTEPSLILSAGRHGEHHAIVDLLTASRGRWRGLVRGGKGRRLSGILQPGNEVEAHWRARLESQLGAVTIELRQGRAGALLGEPRRLSALVSVCATLAACLPEREAHPAVYEAATAFFDLLSDETMESADWGPALVRLEVGLLADLGYGLDLKACAATGVLDDLVYVSPKSGRAVSAKAGKPYHDRLLPLPAFLTGQQTGPMTAKAVSDGLFLTGFFLERLVRESHARPLPQERQRLLQAFKDEGTA